MRRRSFCAPLLLAGLCLHVQARADEVVTLLPLSLDELIATPVITASRRAEGRDQTPAHIMVITRQQMRDRRYKNLADLLEDLPGVDFQRGTRSTQYNNFVFQGHVGNNKLLILLDGVRIDHPAGGKIPVAENFSLYFAKQVEVLYGPAAALYGADAFAGVINIITERAEQSGGKASAGIGSFGSVDGDFLVDGKFGPDITLTVGAHSQHSDRAKLDQYYPEAFPKVDARTVGGTVVVPAAQREAYVGEMRSGSLYGRLDIGEKLTLGFYRNNFRSLSSTGDRTSATIYRDDVFWDTTIDNWYGKYRFQLGDRLSGETIIDHSVYEVSPESRYLNTFTDFADHGYDYSYGRRSGIEQNFTWQANDDHSVQAGVGYRDFHAIETPDLPRPYDTSLGSGNQGMTYPNTAIPLQIFDVRYHSWSGYLQWQARWSPNWSTVAGLRRDWYSTYGGSTNPRAGVVWQPSHGNVFKLLYGEAFRAPSPEESYSAFGSFNGAGNPVGTFRAPNRLLQPERSKTWSLTWDWRPSSSVNLITNAYRTEVDGVIVTRADATPVQYIPGVVLGATESKQNGGRDEYHGIDLIPQWQIHLGGPWTADLWGSYSYVSGRVRETDNGPELRQINIAAHKVKLGVTFRYQDWLTVTPRWQWIGDTSTGAVNRTQNDRVKETGSYAVTSLHIGVHKLAAEHLSLYLDIYNLFDRRYYAAHTSSSSAVMQAVPQQPRTVMGTVELRF
ncbi:TonB-dependent siderophore receptor [Azonexus sp. R2A61]|uniref:TonB-dependent receptor plug domain-containing protein n=1 Tax=Azonexus sp. R2A61 TaxID=2744443 RepID=UPI001F30D455|nr:TonB-dependent receptor [Azonexus sp. R2A61]